LEKEHRKTPTKPAGRSVVIGLGKIMLGDAERWHVLVSKDQPDPELLPAGAFMKTWK